MFINKWKPIVDYVDVQKNVVPYFKFDEMKQLEEEAKNDESKEYSCNEPWGQVSIFADGTVGPCCTTFGRNKTIGNIKDQTLEEIWTGEVMNKLRDGLIKNKPDIVCKTCLNNCQNNLS